MRRATALASAPTLRTLTIAVAAGALALGTIEPGFPRSSPSFPCRWTWDLRSGTPAGQVVAGFAVDCSSYGRRGSLMIEAKLAKWNPRTRSWQAVASQARRWTSFRGRRYVELSRPCTVGTFRATFQAVLRDSGNAVVDRLPVTTGPLHVVVPCAFTLG